MTPRRPDGRAGHAERRTAAGRRQPGIELLYVSSTFGGQTRNFYRFQMQDASTDFFDEDGSGAEQFLLRNPPPNGRFTSGFGARRHPILGHVKMHTGTDWAAPTGTPIIAAGNGVIEKAERVGGFGNRTINATPIEDLSLPLATPTGSATRFYFGTNFRPCICLPWMQQRCRDTISISSPTVNSIPMIKGWNCRGSWLPKTKP